MVRPAQLGNYLHHQLAGAVWAELVFSFQVSGARYASNQSAAATATCSNVPASSKRCVAPRMRSSCLCKQRNLLKASRLSISTISSRSLHPVCKLNAEPTSYPSGHTLSGYLLAFALVEMVPEKSKEILARAADYISVYQVLLSRPSQGDSKLPLRREDWYSTTAPSRQA